MLICSCLFVKLLNKREIKGSFHGQVIWLADIENVVIKILVVLLEYLLIFEMYYFL